MNKHLLLAGSITICAALLFSCQKELPYDLNEDGTVAEVPQIDSTIIDSDTSTLAISENNILRVVQGQGNANDTVYLLAYNNYNKVKSVVDSLHRDSLIGYYEADSTLQKIDLYTSYGASSPIENYVLSYDNNQRITEVEYTVSGQHNRLVYLYANGATRLPSQKDLYTDFGQNTDPELWKSFTYEFTNGNITKMIEYNDAGAPTGLVVTYDYTKVRNIFKNLAFFNLGNYLGLEEIINNESFFNRHLIRSYTITAPGAASLTIQNTYDINSKDELAAATSRMISASGDTTNIYTRRFFY